MHSAVYVLKMKKSMYFKLDYLKYTTRYKTNFIDFFRLTSLILFTGLWDNQPNEVNIMGIQFQPKHSWLA